MPEQANQPQSSPEDRFRKLEEARLARPWRYFTPIPRIRDGFLRSKAPYRLLTGPNGGGKTRVGAALLACYLTGYNHWTGEHYETPNRCWAVALDRINQLPVMLRELEGMLPQGTRWIEKYQKFVLPDPWNSECYVKVCESGWLKFTAERILAAWFDEEWPGEDGLRIWKETMRRTKPGWPLHMFMTVTPLQGYTWTWDHLWKEDSQKRFKGVEAFNFSLYDAMIENGGFLTPEEVADAESKCTDPYERKSRIFGEYTHVGGTPAFPIESLAEGLRRGQFGVRCNISAAATALSPTSPVLEPDAAGDLVILHKPEPNVQYIMGVDPAMGIRRDYSASSVWRRDIPVECAYFKSNSIDPGRFAREVAAPLCVLYNNALAAPEINSDGGGAFIANLQQVYGHIFMRQEWDSTRPNGSGGRGVLTRKYGFRTGLSNRGLLFSTFRQTMLDPSFVPSKDIMEEAMNMVVSAMPSGESRIDHMAGRHDDHLFAGMIALAVNRMNPAPKYDMIESYREEYAGNEW